MYKRDMFIDARIMGVSNGFVVVRPRTKIEIEDSIQRPDMNLVFEDVEKLCDWIRDEYAKLRNLQEGTGKA